MHVLGAGTGLAGGRPVGVLAQNNFGDTVPDGVAGPLGLFIILLLAVATVLLIRNMNSRLRRLPESFPDPAGPAPAGPAPASIPPTSAVSALGGDVAAPTGTPVQPSPGGSGGAGQPA